MLGLDAADIEYQHEHLSHFPHLGQLFKDGRLLRLTTTAEALDASVSPTFALESHLANTACTFPSSSTQSAWRTVD